MKFTKTNILAAITLILLTLNLTTLAAIWPYINFTTFTFSLPSPKNVASFIIDKLNFNNQQQIEFTALRKEHFEEIKELQNQLLVSKADMYASLKSIEPDTVTTFSKLASMMIIEERLNHITKEHFRKVRNICNDEQKQHFDAIIDKVMQQVEGTLESSNERLDFNHIQTPLP